MSKKKCVKQEFLPSSVKLVKHTTNPNSFYDRTPTWSFSKCDFSHDKWGICSNQDCLPGLMQSLKSFECRQWKDILSDTAGRRNNTKNRPIPIANLNKKAQIRLEEMNLDDFDVLYSLSITGKHRLWGVIVDGVFCIVWYDLEHEICPSHKINT